MDTSPATRFGGTHKELSGHNPEENKEKKNICHVQ